MDIVHHLDEHVWREFIYKHPESQIFHSPEMYEVFERTKGHTPRFWAAVDDDGRPLVLLLPVQVTLMENDKLRRYLTRRNISYASVLCAPGAEAKQALGVLLEEYKRGKGRILFTEFRNLTNLNGYQPIMEQHGFEYEDHLNYLIDLNGTIDDVMARMSKSTRKDIRRSIKKGEIELEEVTERSKVRECYKILEQTYELAQVPLADISMFEAAFDVLYPKNMIRFLLAKVEGKYIATSVELPFKNILYAWYGGVDREYSKYRAGEFVMWDIFRWGIENGYTLYDFGGAGKPDEEYPVRDWKAKFGGELVSFGRNVCIHDRPTLTLSKIGYSVYRKFL